MVYDVSPNSPCLGHFLLLQKSADESKGSFDLNPEYEYCCTAKVLTDEDFAEMFLVILDYFLVVILF